jgi:DNA-binding PadR family transcriptional regulator
MVPDTRYAILGLLARRPDHGYELAVRFGQLFGPGWAINRGQVYDMLGILEGDGLVECLPGPQAGRNVKHYRITQSGERALADWLATPCTATRPLRETLYLKLALARPQDAEHLLQSIAAREQACVDRLRAYAEETCGTPADASEWELLAREGIDEAATIQLDGELVWLSKMRKRLERLREAAQSSATTAADPISRRSDTAAA